MIGIINTSITIIAIVLGTISSPDIIKGVLTGESLSHLEKQLAGKFLIDPSYLTTWKKLDYILEFLLNLGTPLLVILLIFYLLNRFNIFVKSRKLIRVSLISLLITMLAETFYIAGREWGWLWLSLGPAGGGSESLITVYLILLIVLLITTLLLPQTVKKH